MESPTGLGTDAESGQSDLRFQIERALAAVRRRKWLILLVSLCGTAAGVTATRFVDLEYEAQTTFWVETSEQQDRGPIRSEQLLQSSAWIELLKSYQVLDYVVTDQKLFIKSAVPQDAPLFASFALQERFRPGKYEIRVLQDGAGYELLSNGVRVEQGRIGSPIGEPVGFNWTPSPEQLRIKTVIRFEVLNPRDVAGELGQSLRTRMAAQEGNFLGLSLSGPDPEQTASTLNVLADRYVDLAAQLKRAKLEELTGVLDEQRRYAEQELREAEIALEGFRVQTITLPSDRSAPIAAGLEATRNPVFDRFFEIRIEREQLRQDREALDRLLKRAASSTTALDALTAVPAVAASPVLAGALQERNTKLAELRSLETRYTGQHREVQRVKGELAALERKTIPHFTAVLSTELANREAELDRQIDSAAGELQQIPPRAIEEARLRRRVEIADNLHTTLKQRYEEARLAAAGSIPDIRVLDRAVVPYEPISDQRPLFILLGLLGGFGLAVAGVLLLERLDARVRYPEQITKELGLTVLGLVPVLQSDEQGAAATLRASEALREIRFSLVHAHGTAGPLLLTVTSPESGEGKSFITSNLAVAFGEQGHQTLIIDGDTRRGRLHRLFQGQRTPGLTDFLSGTASLEEIIRPTTLPSVWMIASGTRTRQGPELLSSTAMSQLVHGLRERFGAILIDSPPLGAGVDAYALGTITRNMLLVLRVGQTDREFAEAKLHLLDRLPVRLLGAVLNCAPESHLYRNYYYLPGYEAEMEDAEAVVLPAQS